MKNNYSNHSRTCRFAFILFILASTSVIHAQNSFPTPTGVCVLDATGTSAGQGGQLRLGELNANGSNYVGIKAPDLLSSNQVYVFPNGFPGGSGKVLSSDNTGNLSWVKRAKTDMSNLDAITAINITLLPQTNNTIDLGSSSLRWRDIHLHNLKFSDGTTLTTAPLSSQWSNASTGIYYGSGNVGIGASVPSAPLDVVTSSTIQVARFDGLAPMYIGLYEGGIYRGYIGSYSGGTSDIDLGTGSGNTLGNLNLTIQGTPKFTISSAGNVGVGTTSPAYKLDVTGDLNLSEGNVIKVDGATVMKVDFNLSFGGNTLVGNDAGSSITTGTANCALGDNALLTTTTGNDNIAIGAFSLYANTTGSGNVSCGRQSLTDNTSGDNNTAFGTQALYVNTSGINNTAIGKFSLQYTSTALGNTAIGYKAGSFAVNGNHNTFVGDSAYALGAGHSNSSCLGYSAYITASNQVRIGNSSVTSIGGYADWSNISDGRVKKNVARNVPGLVFINKLQPVTYNLSPDAIDEIIEPHSAPDAVNTTALLQEEIYAKSKKESIVYTGFIAQDVEKAAREVGYDFSGVDAPKNKNDLYGLRYGEFVVPLVKAVQELSKQNDDLKKEMEELKSSIVNRESSIRDGFSKLTTDNKQLTAALLGQNIPNPFDNSTLIPFRIPKDCNDASIMITNTSTSEVISVVPISCGEDHISIDAGSFASGTYSYTLYVDGRLVDTKQMALTK